MIKRQRVDWKEHPIEVMASIDYLAGAAWRKDAGRCVWALGAPLDELHAWLSRAVDFAKKVPFNDESVEYVGAARLVGRLRELGGMKPRKDATPPEIALAAVLVDYAKGGKMRPIEPKLLAKRTFFRPYAEAAVAARRGDARAMSVALGRVPWRERREWTGADRRKHPPHWSFFTMGLTADHGFEALPPTARAHVDRDVINGALR